MIRVLVVDDHPLFRFGLRASLGTEPDIEVVGEAVSGASAVESVAVLCPDVVVMDINLPDMSGIEATRRIMERHPAVSVLMLTMLEDDRSVLDAMRAGARGYFPKGAAPADVARAVRAVGDSEAVFAPAIATRLLSFLAGAVPPRAEEFPELTERECDILWLIARGESNGTIARRLVLSPKTVRNHVSNIYRKLHVADRVQAIARVREIRLRDRNRDRDGTTDT
ncbi:MAG TPA: response regulator transcription factor [Pseudonocardiaceae bacterium]